MLEDASQLAAFRRGERSTLAALYSAHVQPLANYLRRGFSVHSANGPVWIRGVSSTFELEGLCQEVFTRVFTPKARLNYDPTRPFEAFLFTIAKNLRIDRHRRNRLQLVGDGPLEDPLGPQPTPADGKLMGAQLKELMRGFVDELGQPDQDYYRFRYHDGLNQTEAAQRLGLGRTPGRALEIRIKRKLTALLRRHGLRS